MHDRDINASINLYFVGLGRPEVTPVERALVDDRSHHASKQEAQLQKVEQSAIHYSNIILMHVFLKYTGILPDEYNCNIWYRCVAAYIIDSYVNVEKIIELNKYGWTEAARKESERLVLDADIITLL